MRCGTLLRATYIYVQSSKEFNYICLLWFTSSKFLPQNGLCGWKPTFFLRNAQSQQTKPMFVCLYVQCFAKQQIPMKQHLLLLKLLFLPAKLQQMLASFPSNHLQQQSGLTGASQALKWFSHFFFIHHHSSFQFQHWTLMLLGASQGVVQTYINRYHTIYKYYKHNIVRLTGISHPLK